MALQRQLDRQTPSEARQFCQQKRLRQDGENPGDFAAVSIPAWLRTTRARCVQP